MSTWARTIRPFVGIGTLQDVMSQCLLHFGADPCQADGTLHVDISPHEFLLRPVALDWTTDDDSFSAFRLALVAGASEAEIPLTDLALVVVTSTPFLRFSEIVFQHHLRDLESLPRSVNLTEGPPRPRAFSAPHSGFRVDAFLVIAASRPRVPLRPYRKGTWLSRSRFVVTTTMATAILPPAPLTAEVRQRFRLPAKSMRYVDWNEHDVTEPHAMQNDPVLYVDEDLLAQLNSRRASATGRAVQVQLVVDFLSQVVQRGAAKGEDLLTYTYDDIRESLLGSVVRIAAGPGASDARRTALLHDVPRDSGMVIANVEHAIDALSAYAASMKDGDA